MEQLEKGLLDNREVTIEIEEPKKTMPAMNNGLEQMGIDLNETLGALSPKKKIERTVTVKEAQELLVKEESAKIVNDADIHSEAIRLLLKAPKLTRSMVLYKRITFYLSLQVLSTCQNQVT